MRRILLSLAILVLSTVARGEPFEIKDGDRVLFLGDTLLEREGTYGYLETRMAEQFPDRKFTVRNLAFSADTPLGWSRASFDPPAKGFERLKEQLALVKPTVVFLGYGMAASLQEMTDRSQDWTLNRDPARYGAEPMSAARFKKELAQCMDAIVESAVRDQESEKNVGPARSTEPAIEKGSARAPRAVPGASPGTPGVATPPQQDAPPTNERKQTPDASGGAPDAARGARALPDARKSANQAVRFVLLSPIRHEDLRATRPGLPDPTEHNKLLEQYSKAIEELAKERGGRFVSLATPASQYQITMLHGEKGPLTENGIHASPVGWQRLTAHIAEALGWSFFPPTPSGPFAFDTEEAVLGLIETKRMFEARILPAIIRKNALFFHRWRPANETYLFGFRKREQGQNAVEIPKFDPLIEAAEAEIERLKKSANAAAPLPNAERRATGSAGVPPAGSGVSPEPSGVARTPNRDTPSANERNSAPGGPRETRGPAGGTPALPANTPADTSRQTRAETPDLSKIAVSPSTLPLPAFTLADGLEISLWAENPLLAKPTECNWDAQGRLWVASSAMYPMIAPGQEATDKIIILEDPGHTGKATKATVFVDGLLIPTGVVPVMVTRNAEGGTRKEEKTGADAGADSAFPVPRSAFNWACYVGQSTELLYFEDTDGDGKADRKRIVFSGFGTEDTHHIVHTLRWGPDGRLYFSQSVYIHTHMETPWGVVRVNSGGVFAYDPRTERVEVVEKGLWNTWGHAWDKWGQAFYTDGAGSSGLSWGFPGATFAPNEGARRTMASISPGSYPKFAGLEIIYSPHFPADWQGTAVTNDFRAHKVVHFKINDLSAERKSGYVTEQLPVLVQTSDATFRPIDVKLGPDGALYIADWSNPIINHGEVDFRDPRRDHEHGRIWRLSMKGGAAVKWESLAGKKTEDVVAALLGMNHWAREQARAVLRTMDLHQWEKGVTDAFERLSDSRRDEGNEAFHGSKLELGWLLSDASPSSFWSLFGIPGLASIPHDGNPHTTAMLANLVVSVANRNNAFAKANRELDLQKRTELEQRADRKLAERNDAVEASLDETRGEAFRLAAIIGEKANENQKVDRLKVELSTLKKRITDLETEHDLLLRTMAPRKISPVVLNQRSAVVSLLNDTIHNHHPRVRVEAMRALARIPAVESASLILDAAINAPKDDPQYEFAAWLSINDLAPQVAEWVEKNSADTAANATAPDAGRRASGSARAPRAVPGAPPGTPGVATRTSQDTPPEKEGKQTPDASGGAPDAARAARALPSTPDHPVNPDARNATAARDAKILLALESLPPDTTAPLIAKILAKRPVTRDGAGPWIELIGKGGGPAELKGLFERVAKSDLNQPALVRALNALAAAARLRNLRPEGDLTYVAALIQCDHADTRAAAARLAGLWHLPEAAPQLEKLAKYDDAGLRTAAFEGLRSLGGVPAVTALENLVRSENPSIHPAALAALAHLQPAAAMAEIPAVLGAIKSEPELLATWRGIFQSKGAVEQLSANFPANLPKPIVTAALHAARELGRPGQRLVAKLTPLAGEITASTAPADYNDLAARAKKDGDPVAGEAMYRRMASACTTCHAIGGAGGKLGPDMTSIGASAPADYIIESILNPAAKVKEGYHAFSFTMKDGTEAIGIPSRETPQEQFIRTIAGEQGLPKANIVSKKLAEGGASLMPVGLTAAWTDRERLNLYAFLMELGRPGPFDASKNNVARVWQLSESDARNGVLPPAAAITTTIPAYTLVDGRLTKDLLAEKITVLAPKGATVLLTARFQAATTGKARLNLTGIRKAWLDGQPLAIASEPSPSVDLSSGAHTFTVEVDALSPPEVLRLESPAVSFLGD